MLVRRQLRYRYQPPRRYPPKYLTVPPLHHHRSLARLLRCRSAALIATSPIGGRPTFRVTELGFVTAGDFVTDFVTTLTGFVTGFATARTNRASLIARKSSNRPKFTTQKQKGGPVSRYPPPGPGHRFYCRSPSPLAAAMARREPTVQSMITCSPVAFNDIKHLARSMPADGLEAQDVVPGHFRRGDRFLGKIHTLARFWAKYTRSRAPSLAALPVITWRLRLATVMAGLWSVVAEAAFEPV